MKGIARRYVEFIRRPHVGRLLVVAFLARMPLGIVGFAMLMFLRDVLGNFALAGTAVGINFVALACAAPVQGRLIDRFGPRPILRVTGLVQPLALVALFAAGVNGLPFPVIAVLAGVTGVFASPITTLTRTLWRHLFDREEDRRTAFALDSITVEFNFTLGPAIVGAALAAFGPRAAFGVAIAAVVFSIVVYLGSGALEHFKRVEGEDRHLLGPLTDVRLWIVFVAMFGITVTFGVLEVGYPAFATLLGTPALAGLLLASNALGSAIGGAIYGGLHFKSSVERQFAACMVIMSVPFVLHAVWVSAGAYAVLAFVSGALIAPTLTAHAVLVSRFAPPKYATEAFTWSSTFIVSGIGAGMAVGGMLAEGPGIPVMFAAAAALMLAMGLLTWATLAPRPVASEQPAAD